MCDRRIGDCSLIIAVAGTPLSPMLRVKAVPG